MGHDNSSRGRFAVRFYSGVRQYSADSAEAWAPGSLNTDNSNQRVGIISFSYRHGEPQVPMRRGRYTRRVGLRPSIGMRADGCGGAEYSLRWPTLTPAISRQRERRFMPRLSLRCRGGSACW